MSADARGPVWVVGGCSMDTIIHLDDLPTGASQTVMARESYQAVGGTGAGKALNLKALGLDVCLHTILANDAEGRTVEAVLAEAGIVLEVAAAKALDGSTTPTEQHVNLMLPDGHRLSIYTQPPAAQAATDWTDFAVRCADASIVVANILDYVRAALPAIRATGKPVWTDLHDYRDGAEYYEDFIEAADVIFLSDTNLDDYRATMERLITRAELVICTHGEAGATLLDKSGGWHSQVACTVDPVVDTNGAGDAFFSGFLKGYLLGYTTEDSLKLATACGALAVGSRSLRGEHLSIETAAALVAQQLS
ncbi:carbohydrate kinase family protein [Allohahella marinimesophila]|uniref:Carbohydrate kinase family protein n=1 Tax=Allohahella marinimesophila TaxID=1054972 RepID=A0ABP7PF56_9GAMM